MSGSGTRYANSGEDLCILNKGNTAFMTEGSGKEIYSGCVVAPWPFREARLTYSDAGLVPAKGKHP